MGQNKTQDEIIMDIILRRCKINIKTPYMVAMSVLAPSLYICAAYYPQKMAISN